MKNRNIFFRRRRGGMKEKLDLYICKGLQSIKCQDNPALSFKTSPLLLFFFWGKKKKLELRTYKDINHASSGLVCKSYIFNGV